jgi:hypothetical protein
MLHLQLDSFNFTPLWELIECALFQPEETLEISTPEGNFFRYQGGHILSPFYSFDAWAGSGPGQSVAAEKHELGKRYADWTRVQRQYLVTLRSHGLLVSQHLPGQATQPVTERFLVELSEGQDVDDHTSITEHDAGDLGTVAVTVVRDRQQFNYYPLTPGGLNDIHDLLRDTLGCSANVSFPGHICYDNQTRRLVHDTEACEPAT